MLHPQGFTTPLPSFRQPFKVLSGYPDLLHVELGFVVAITVKLQPALFQV